MSPTSYQVVEPYLFFNGRCEEAIEFYRRALGAELEMLMRFKENPEPATSPEGFGEKVMHSLFRIGKSRIMASDGHCAGTSIFQGFSLSLTASDEGEAERLFSALAEGGKVQMPLAKTFFSPRFGIVTEPCS